MVDSKNKHFPCLLGSRLSLIGVVKNPRTTSYTPDDEGKAVQEPDLKYRARQNVVFEHGFLTGLYGRERVVCLVKKEENIELPGDVSGVVYTDANAHNWRIGIAHSLNQAGYKIDFSKIKF